MLRLLARFPRGPAPVARASLALTRSVGTASLAHSWKRMQAALPHAGRTSGRFSSICGARQPWRYNQHQLRWFGTVTVPVPSLGDSITEGTVVNWTKGKGEFANVDDVVCVLETDKVSVDIRTPVAGVIEDHLVREGDTVHVGADLFKVNPDVQKPAEAKAPAASPKQAAPSSPTPPPKEQAKAPPPKPQAAGPTPPPPVARAAAPPKPAGAAPSTGRNETRVPMSRMRLRIAERLKQAQNVNAMLTTFNEVDMSNLMSMREDFKDVFQEKHGVKLGFMSAFVRASAIALQQFPDVNAVIDGKDIVYRDYVDISVAVATSKGLVVPVLRDCQSMAFHDIEAAIVALGKKARDNQIAIEDMEGGTFTISNGGVYGSLLGTPIINPPQSAILGMHGIFKRPVVVKDQIVIRPMMYVALTYDHRLIDGAGAVTFLRKVKDLVEDPRRMLLAV